jgi:hypothetical protein
MAKLDQEKQRLIDIFIDEAGGDQALFHTPDDIAYADVNIDGHRETWPARSKQFRYAYMRYLRRKIDQLVNTGSASVVKPMSKSAINAAAAGEVELELPGIFGALLDSMARGLEMPTTHLI